MYSRNLTLLLLCLCVNAFSQSPYSTNWKQELPFLSTAAGTMGLATFFYTQPIVINGNDFLAADHKTINSLDQVATRSFSNQAYQLSDILWIGSHLTPTVFLSNKKTRKHFNQIITMYGEAAVINFGLTVITKYTIKRPRPYVYNNNAPDDLRLHANSKTSFVSGHTSMTAVNSFFAAKVFSDFFPESKWKGVIWGTAATIPAITGYLRVKAGRHYPSDVFAGYLLGAAVGVLVPHFHLNSKFKDNRISFQMGVNSFYAVWNFN